MKQYIDKDTVVAEINRVLNSYDPNEITSGRYALADLRNFINTIEVKVEDELADTFIEKACNAYCKVCGHYPHTVPTYICRHDCDYFDDFKKYMKGE